MIHVLRTAYAPEQSYKFRNCAEVFRRPKKQGCSVNVLQHDVILRISRLHTGKSFFELCFNLCYWRDHAIFRE